MMTTPGGFKGSIWIAGLAAEGEEDKEFTHPADETNTQKNISPYNFLCTPST
jgi:hypothetical protein